MANGLPYFRWYPADAETDEHYSAMTDAELGFYHRCLNKAWINDGIPADQNELARTMRVTLAYLKKIWPRIGDLFSPSELDPKKLVNARQELERSHATGRVSRSSDAAFSRHARNANALPRAYDSDSDSSGRSTEVPVKLGAILSETQCAEYLRQLAWNPRNITEKQAEDLYDFDIKLLEGLDEDPKTLYGVVVRIVQFEVFWKDYWRRVGKKKAREEYFRQTDDFNVCGLISLAVEAQKPAMLRREDDKRPHASTWLHQHRWLDEAPENRNASGE